MYRWEKVQCTDWVSGGWGRGGENMLYRVLDGELNEEDVPPTEGRVVSDTHID